jgi:uncharacterized membrane protein YfcA
MIEFIGFVVLGLATGLIAATLGIGGGIILVPSLAVIFGFAQHIAQGTSLAVIVPTAIVGTVLHAKRQRVDWRVAGNVALGGVIGGLVGSTAALAMEATLLRRLFAGLLALVAIRMLSNSLRRQ